MNEADLKSYVGFWVVMIGIIILNVADPPLQFVGLAIFIIAMVGTLK